MYARVFFNEWRQAILQEEKLKQEAIILQYKVLSNQVNPHFLFNSLNVLSSLIRIDVDRAEVFVGKLSDFYRNILSFKHEEVISLNDELVFVKQYLDLQKERFGDSVEIYFSAIACKDCLVIPMSVQMLVENAIKHNQISRSQHLIIEIYTEDQDFLVVKNNIKPYVNPVEGEKLGLKKLCERYCFLTDKPMEISEMADSFIVKVPLLREEKVN